MCHGSTLRPPRAFFVGLIAMVASLLVESRSTFAGEPSPAYPASRLGVRTAPLLLLSRPDVREDLVLTAEQVESAERTMADLYMKAMGLRGQTGPQVIAARRQVDEAQQDWLDVRLTPEQRTRLAQIDLQWEGPSAVISRPVVAESLGLTPDQSQAILRAVTDRNRQRDAGQAGSPEEHMLAQQVLSILTADQQARWKAMLGRPFAPQMAQRPALSPR